MYKNLKINRKLCKCISLGKHIDQQNRINECKCENQHIHNAPCKCVAQHTKMRKVKKCNWNMHSHYICNRQICLNLAGLTDNLNYKLLSKHRRPIEIGTIGGETFNGKTKHVGIDYVNIQEKDSSIVTILKNKIKFINFK